MDNILVWPIQENDQERPIWSVMIPTYNCAKYLAKTLQNVLSQDRGEENMEIWVVDDHSTEDDPKQVVDEIGKGRVKFFRQKSNVGQLNNFETCLNLSRGKVIHLLHGDDFVHPGFYERLEKPLLGDEEIGAAFTGYRFIDANGDLVYNGDIISDTPGVLDHFTYSIASKQVIQTPSIVVKRAVYEKLGGFNKRLKGCEDWEMWVRISCHFKFYYEPKLLASYRIHNNSNTGGSLNSGRFIDDAVACMQIYRAYLPGNNKEKKKIIEEAKVYSLDYAFTISNNFMEKHGDTEAALTVLFKCFKLAYNLRSHLGILKRILKIKYQQVVGNIEQVRSV